MKLFYYSNLSGNACWARNPQDFRKKEGLPGHALAVRAAHKGIAPPVGYFKPNGELANDAVCMPPVPTFKPGRRYQPISLTDLGAVVDVPPVILPSENNSWR